MDTIKNKYNRWYWNIIQFRKQNPATAPRELHHIIPKSLGGTDDPANIVSLSCREHFVVHLLLPKMLVGAQKSSMWFAARRMLRSDRKITSRIYEMVKREANIATAALWDDPIWRERISQERKERCKDPEVRKQRSEIMLDVWQRPEYVQKHKEAMKQVISDPTWIENNRKKQKETWQDPVKRHNRLKNRKPHSPEIRKIQSEAATLNNKKTWADPVVRAKRIEGIKRAIAKKKSKAINDLASITEKN